MSDLSWTGIIQIGSLGTVIAMMGVLLHKAIPYCWSHLCNHRCRSECCGRSASVGFQYTETTPRDLQEPLTGQENTAETRSEVVPKSSRLVGAKSMFGVATGSLTIPVAEDTNCHPPSSLPSAPANHTQTSRPMTRSALSLQVPTRTPV